MHFANFHVVDRSNVTMELRLLRLETTDRLLKAIASRDESDVRDQEQALVWIDHLLRLQSRTTKLAPVLAIDRPCNRAG
jgi:hypothetical protein